MELLAFVLVSFFLIVIPGPNVLVIVSTSLAQGVLRGLQTVAGTSCAMLLQLAIAALGTTWFVQTLGSGFYWLKWCGVVYLVYLGLAHLRQLRQPKTMTVSALGSFSRGFFVSLTNPKTILFFSAFLPQFTVAGESYFSQIVLLSLIFWALAVVLDSAYALLAGAASGLLKSEKLHRVQNSLCGSLYLGAGAVLATLQRNN